VGAPACLARPSENALPDIGFRGAARVLPWTENPRVGGSVPPQATNIHAVPPSDLVDLLGEIEAGLHSTNLNP
jgi:hypothetical protein